MTVHTYPNSLVNRVVEAVLRRGTATLDDLTPEFPGVSRKQLHAALSNARDRKRLQIKTLGRRYGPPSVWEPWPEQPEPPKQQAKPVEPVPSVFHLGRRRPWLGTWPPLPAGRLVARLGPWNEQAEAATAGERTTA